MNATRPPSPILITGPIRSGTTWVGEMIRAHPGMHYFAEPMNPVRHDYPLDSWWRRVTRGDEREFRGYLRPYYELSYPWWERRKDFPPGLRERIALALEFRRERRAGVRPLVKDPLALCSAEWLADTYGSRVIVLIRHPAAFVSSLKRLRWFLPFDALLDQQDLMREDLSPFAAEMQSMLARPWDIIDHGILGWRVLHHLIRRYQERRPDFRFCRHEDLSLRPIEEFSKLFDWLELDFTAAVRSAVERHSDERNPREAGGEVHQLYRNSKANIWNWQERLTPEEITRVERETRDVAQYFYDDADWWRRQPLAA